MRCPLDDTQLREVTREGVQIDICPSCKGVWLDRGELEKLMEVSEREELAYERSGSRRGDGDSYDDDRRRGGFFGSSGDSYFGSSGDRVRGGRYDDDDRRRGYPRKKKKSWFSQMMESVGGDD